MNFIRLFNVEFNEKYDDVIKFASKADQSSYFSSRFVAEFNYDNLSVVKELSAVRVYGNYNKLQTVNYAYFENEIEGVTRGYYAFVTSVSWAGVDVVALTLSIDVYQTYLFEHSLVPSYVRRGHVHQFDKSNKQILRKYLLTPEDIDFGDEYETSDSHYLENVTYRTGKDIIDYLGIEFAWVVIVGSDAIKNAEGVVVGTGGNIGIEDGLYYLMTPIVFQTTPLSERPNLNIFLVGSDDKKYGKVLDLETIAKDFAGSPSVKSIYVLRSAPYALVVDATKDSESGSNFYDIALRVYATSAEIRDYAGGHSIIQPISKTVSWSNKEFDYLKVNPDIDIKAQCYPYSYLSITNDRGNELIVKPQYLTDSYDDYDKFFDIFYTITLTVGAYAKQGVGLEEYLGTPKLRQVVDTSLGELALRNDAYLNFLNTQKASFDTGLNNIYAQGALSLIGGVAGGVAAGASGNYLAAAGALGGTIFSGASTAMKIAAQQARVQDIQNTPDSLKKPGTDIKFEHASKYWGIYITKYTVPQSVQERVSDYFYLYGYTVNDFIRDFDEFLNTRETFNFIQTTSCRVVGKINVEHIVELERIYDHGVRLWHYKPDTWTGFDFTKKNGDYYE